MSNPDLCSPLSDGAGHHDVGMDIGQTTLTSFFATVRSAPGVGGKPGPQLATIPAKRISKPVVPDARRAAGVGTEVASSTSASARDGTLAPIPAGPPAAVSLMRRIDQALACTELPLEVSCCPLVPAQRRSYGVLVRKRVSAEIPPALLASLASCPEFSVAPSVAALFPEDRCPLDHHLVLQSAVQAVSTAARAFAKTAFLPKPWPHSPPEYETPGTPVAARSPLREENPIGTPLAASIWTGRATTASPAVRAAVVVAAAAVGGEERVGGRRERRGSAAVAPSVSEPASKRQKHKPRFRVTVAEEGGGASSSHTATPKKAQAWSKSSLVPREGEERSPLESLKHEHFPMPSRACISLPFGIIKPTSASGGMTLSQVNEMVNASRHAGHGKQHAARRAPDGPPCMMDHLPVTPPDCALPPLKPRTPMSTMTAADVELASLMCYEDLSDAARMPSSQMDLENMYLSPREDMTFRMQLSHKSTLNTTGARSSRGNILLNSPLSDEAGRNFLLPSPLPLLGATSSGAQTSAILSNFFANSPLISASSLPLQDSN